ncbi:histone-lysine N-methyltransferase ASHR2 [Angomonas deanei]|uniref:SET domain containing protein, putative n=1 Tax=Angomonas deanei TaxID=59799 RepID=A0A7G2CDQ1_9TRYP|nr:histone-lysine N-methyltransferase ASHR2 [Angomonas deanei]CAD2217077.1 SET domain containing protein, putative [Angomonas deanei]|eukprot:EPY35227.1 histone-lysine N-methyltransferase ASHR2 [Angomonas deanei]
MPVDLEVKELPDRGRGVVAANPVDAGSVLFFVEPDLAVLYSDSCSAYCARCFLELTAGMSNSYTCPTCDQFVLCHRCHVESEGDTVGGVRNLLWMHNRYVCPWYNELPSAAREKGQDTDYVRFALQYMAQSTARHSGETANAFPAQALLALDDSANSQSAETLQFCEDFSKKVIHSFGKKGGTPPVHLNAKELSDVLLITKNNSLGFPCSVRDGELSTIIGWSLQSAVCRLNHSCDPNAEIVFPEAQKIDVAQSQKIKQYNGDTFVVDEKASHSTAGCMAVRSLRPIAKGEEVTISYVNMGDSALASDVRARSRHLLEQYRFLCKCPLCLKQRDRN